MSSLTLEFDDKSIETEYKRNRIKRTKTFIRWVIWFLTVCVVLYQILDMILEDYEPLILTLRLSAITVLVFFSIYLKTKYFKKQYLDQVILLTIAVTLVYKFTNEVLVQNDASMSTAITVLATFILFNVSTYKIFSLNLIYLFGYFLRITYKYSTSLGAKDAFSLLSEYLILLTGLFLLSAYIGRSVEVERRNEFKLMKKKSIEYTKYHNILKNLLPDFVSECVKQRIAYIGDEKELVTVMFCDIYDFDSICASHSSDELIYLLHRFFSVIDKLCYRYGLTKIETVNKTYMVCGGLEAVEAALVNKDIRDTPHAERCINMALKITRKLRGVKLKNGKDFSVKIGIHSGSVIAGIVGDHKPQFALVGDTVNTASRMCSTITCPGQIQISECTYNLIDSSKYVLAETSVYAKGKGDLKTYLVESGHIGMHSMKGNEVSMSTDLEGRLIVLQNYNLPKLRRGNAMDFTQDILDDISHAKKAEHNNETAHIPFVTQLSWATLNCREGVNEKQFRSTMFAARAKSIMRGLWLSIVIYLFLSTVIMFFLAYRLSASVIVYVFSRLLSLALMVVSARHYKEAYDHRGFPCVISLIYLSVSIEISLSPHFQDEIFVYSIILELMYMNVVVEHVTRLPFGITFWSTNISTLIWLTSILFTALPASLKYETTIFYLIFTQLNCYARYTLEKQERDTYNIKLKTDEDIKRTESLLIDMLPQRVLQNLKQGITSTDTLKDVTILYADITGFTSWAADKTPKEVIDMLTHLFYAFDQLCSVHNVYKVHTIGDCYVVLSSTDPESQQREQGCLHVVQMALGMQAKMCELNVVHSTAFLMRIGVHTGTVIAGISGTEIVRYDVYGPDNDIANKMESEGFPGAINVSIHTMNLLVEHFPGQFTYKSNKCVLYKPTGASIDCFFLSNP